MTPSGYIKLIEHEGEKFSAYRDSEGYLAIGVGHCIDERCGCGITQQMSRTILDDDLARWTATARANFEWFDGLDDVRKDVVVMLLFNMGLGGLGTFKNMIAAVREHNWHQAAFELANSKWGRQVQHERKRDLCDALEKGVWR